MAEIVPMMILLLTLSLAFALEPGAKLAVTNKGLDYANQIAVTVLRDKLRTISIPNQSGRDGILSWSVNNIRITGISGPNTKISPNPRNDGVILSIRDFDVNLHADWDAEFWIIFRFTPSGSLDLSVSGTSVTLVAGLGENNGRPSVFAKSCSSSIYDIDINFQGGLVAFILNLFKGAFRDRIRNLLQDKVCDLVREQVNTRANHELSRMKVNVDIGKDFILDYSLIRAPTITDNYIELATKGTVYWKDTRQESPFTAAIIPALSEFSNMLYVYVTEFSANTFAYTAHTYGFLKYNVTVANLPVGKSDLLDPTGQLKDKYPNSKLELRISSAIAPSVKFEDQNLTVAAVANVEVVVHTPDGVVYPLALRVTVSLTVQPSVINGNLTANITTFTFTIAVIESAIGDINEQDLNKLIREPIDAVVIPGLNAYCKQGIPLPVTDIFRMYNTQLNLKTGYLQVGTDVGYQN